MATLESMREALFETVLYVATSNAGKLRDFAAASTLLSHTSEQKFVLRPLPGLDHIPSPTEDAETFAGNASLKALAYSLYASGEIVIADDSGLEVAALGGAPGVHSARYAAMAGYPNPGQLTDDQLNNAFLLHQLQSAPGASRRARYRCVLAAARDGILLNHGSRPALGIGTIEGIVLDEPRGTGGFGYDPLFLLADYDQTMAEIDMETRLKVSHRTRALAGLLPLLEGQ